MIVLCAIMMLIEIIGGIIFGSIALVADGLHMSTHAGALLLAALAYTFSRRYAKDERFTFGTGKLGDLAGFTSAIVLAMISLLIGYEAVARLFAPVPIHFSETIPIAVLGLCVNVASAWLLSGGPDHGHSHGHEHSHAHQEKNDHNHGHEHSHAHDEKCEHESHKGHDHAHQHGHEHSHAHPPAAVHETPGEAEVHDHGWAPWKYAVLFIPVVMYFLNLPSESYSEQRLSRELRADARHKERRVGTERA